MYYLRFMNDLENIVTRIIRICKRYSIACRKGVFMLQRLRGLNARQHAAATSASREKKRNYR